MKLKFVSLLAGFMAVSGIANAATIVNGSFEADLQPNQSWSNYTNLTGWTGGAGGIELRNNVAGQAEDGVNFVELDTYQNSLASQVIGVVAGQSYAISFYYSPRTGIAADSNGISVFWDGVQKGTYTGTTSANDAWVKETIFVTGDISGFGTLRFDAVGISDSFGGSLDNISIASVPEASTWAMMIVGFLGVGLVAHRRKSSGAAFRVA
jgi:hypothetical protein